MNKYLSILFISLVFLSLNVCDVRSMGYFPKETPETPVPVPTPEPTPVPTTTTEQGRYSQTGQEVDFYFSKPIDAYGKFDLATGGKIYTIKGSYKDGLIEVRNAGSTGSLVVISDLRMQGKQAKVTYPSTKPLTQPDTSPAPDPKPDDVDIPITTRYNHVNNFAFDGRGVAINMCKSEPPLRGATLNGVKMRLHVGKGQGNCNREIWTNVYFVHNSPTKVDGEIVVEFNDGTKGRIKINGARPYWHQNKGGCFINCAE